MKVEVKKMDNSVITAEAKEALAPYGHDASFFTDLADSLEIRKY